MGLACGGLSFAFCYVISHTLFVHSNTPFLPLSGLGLPTCSASPPTLDQDKVWSLSVGRNHGCSRWWSVAPPGRVCV